MMISRDTVICEWYFKHMIGEEINEFNGVSLIKFNEEYKITDVKEFMPVLPIRYPYSS